jgi:outer membrane lipoprotein-sorting protein
MAASSQPMNRFKSLLACVAGAAASAALVVSAPAPLAAQEAPSGDLASAITALRAITTMRADFVQSGRGGQRIKGVLTLKRPGRIRFQYERGIPFLIVSDGKALTFVDYEVRQVQRWPIRNSPLGALLDPSRDVMQFGRLVSSDRPQLVSVEVRDRKHPEYGVITLIFVRKAAAPGGLELASWATLDSQNNRTAVALSNQQYGVEVGDNAFRFKDPRPVTRR